MLKCCTAVWDHAIALSVEIFAIATQLYKKIAFVYTVLFVGVIVYYKNKTDFSLSFLDVT